MTYKVKTKGLLFVYLAQKDGSTLVTVEHVEKILPQLVSEDDSFLT